MKVIINELNMAQLRRSYLFKDTYRKHLKALRLEQPDYFVWPIEDLEIVTDRMLDAIDAGSFNKDSLSFKRTCKELGIPHTYKAIKEWTHG